MPLPIENPDKSDLAVSSGNLSLELLDVLEIAVVKTDFSGNIISWNKAAIDLFKWDEKLLKGCCLSNFFSEIKNHDSCAEVFKLLDKKKSWKGQIKALNGKCETFNAALNVAKISGNNDGQEISFAFIPIDLPVKELPEIEEHEAKISSIYRAAPVGIGVIVDRIIQDVNDYFCKMVGFTKEELVGRNAKVFYLDEEVFDNLGSSFFPHFENGITKSIETRFKRNDGQVLHVLLSVTPLFEKDRNRGLTFTVTDITDRKNAEKQLKLSHETYLGIINSVREAIFIQDKQGKILDLNETAIRFFGFPKEDLVGQNLEFLMAAGKNNYKQIIKKIESTFKGRSSVFEFWGRRKNGDIFPNEVSLSPGYYFGKEVVVSVCRDITERKQSEESLKESYDRLTNLMNSIDALIYVIDMETYEILFLNDHGKREMGDVAGKICWKVLQKDQKGPCRFCTNHLLMNHKGQPLKPYQWEFQNSITGRWYDCRDQAIPWNDGRLVRLEVAIDITARKLAEEALRFELGFKDIVADVSSRFVNIGSENLDELVNYSLELSGNFFNVDRCFIFQFSEDGKTMDNTHEWCASDISPQRENLQNLPVSLVPWWDSKIRQLEHIHIPDVKALTEEAIAEKSILESQDIKSVLVIPMVVDGQAIGFYGYDSVKKQKVWTDDQISLLKVLTEIVSGGFGKQKARQALQESEMQLRRAQQVGHIGAWTYNLETRKLKASDESHHIFGFDPDKSFNLDDVLHQVLPVHRPMISKSIEEADKLPRAYENVFQVRRVNDNEERDIFVVAEYDKERNSVFGMIQDITERKKADKALRESEKMFRTLVENAFDGIYLMDDRRFIYVNERFCKIVGFEPKEITASDFNLQSLLTGKSKILVEQRYRDRRKDIPLPSSYEMQIVTKKGEVKEVEMSTVMLESGEKPRFLGVMRDITYRKLHQNLEQEVAVAKRSAQFKQNFLANMSHEIRTPITGIIGMAEILSGTPLSVDQQEYLNTLKLSTENLREIINQILDYSKIEAGQMQIKNRVFAVKSLIDNSRKLFESICNKSIELKTYLHEEIPEFVDADEPRITQIINNFLSNAVKFTDKGHISIRIKLKGIDDNNVVVIMVEVEDTGPGIKPSLQNQLFKPFSQLDQADQRVFEGTGLGLSISKELAFMMGGNIGVESEPGEGSRFWFTFQAKTVNSADHSREKAERKIPILKKKLNVLVVEDKKVNQRVISLMLKSLGHEITIASNGAEALEVYKPATFDLVLMDIQMPVMDGITATQKLKQKYTELPPIVGLSANAFEGDKEKYMGKGMDDYLTKPFHGEDFVNLMNRLFGE